MVTSRPEPADSATVAGPLSASVARLCTELRERVGAHTAEGVDRVLRRISEPLQLAVVGRTKSGKSTLVNALIGRRVAPTDIGECTQLVTRFQYGTVDRVELVLHDGTTRAVPCSTDGGLPRDLGTDLEQVSHVEAYLTNAALRDLTVIDTPGLGSLNADSLARTKELLGTRGTAEEDSAAALDPVSHHAIAGAEAVLYVLTQTVRADDDQTLAAFTAATASREAGPVNAVAVLNKADTIEADSMAGSRGDVWRAATLLAENQARVLKPRVAEVLPVMGLLAETTETGVFDTSDADTLHELARLDRATRGTMLMSADLFASWDCGVSVAARERLLARLDLYGIRRALAEIDASGARPTGTLRHELGIASGLSRVRALLDSVFRARADGLKAAAALASLTTLVQSASDAAERRATHDAIEELLARPEMHQLRVLEALTLVSSGAVELPAGLVEEVLRVGSAGTDAHRLGAPTASAPKLAEIAVQRAQWWRSFATFGATPGQARVAHAVHRAYFLMWQRLRGRTEHG